MRLPAGRRLGRPGRGGRPARAGQALPRPRGRPGGLFSVAGVFQQLLRFPSVTSSALPSPSVEATFHLRVESVERFSGDVSRVRDELDAAAAGDRVLIACHNDGECKRLDEVLAAGQLAQSDRLRLVVGRVRAGFRLVDRRRRRGAGRPGAVPPRDTPPDAGCPRPAPPAGIAGHRQLPRPGRGRPGRPRQPRHRPLPRHADAGQERRRGPNLPRVGAAAGPPEGRAPHPRVPRRRPRLRAGVEDRSGAEVRRRRARPSRSCRSSAAPAGSTARTRCRRPSSTWPATWSSCRPCARRSRASPSRPTPTGSRVRGRLPLPGNARPAHDAWPRSRRDMQQSRPMDRLICGDVGYGKTELAIRAAFKAIDNGQQVAVLVPTTVLAEQHYRTFSQRLAEYPVRRRMPQPLPHGRRAEAHPRTGWRRAASTSSSARTGWSAPTCSSRTWAWSSSTRSSVSASSTRNGSNGCGRRWTC